MRLWTGPHGAPPRSTLGHVALELAFGAPPLILFLPELSCTEFSLRPDRITCSGFDVTTPAGCPPGLILDFTFVALATSTEEAPMLASTYWSTLVDCPLLVEGVGLQRRLSA